MKYVMSALLIILLGVAWTVGQTAAPPPAPPPAAPPPAPPPAAIPQATTAPAPAVPATPQSVIKAPRPNGPVARDSCATAQCHAEVKQFKVLHGPVNVDACDACHKPVDEAAHTYELTRNKTETCTFCHQVDTRNDPIVHKPLADGECLSCHNPHGGNSNKFTRGNSMRELCATCHKDDSTTKKHLHGPVAAGACDSCHTSHSSKFANLLPATGRDLCFTCHAEMNQQMATAKVTHKAVEGDCADCHDPHASDFPMQVKQEPLKLCASCHEKEANKAANATFKHSVVTQDTACLNCHTAHGGDLAALMKNEPVDVCMKCHQTDQKDQKGRVIKNVAVVMDPKQVKHGPIRDGNCSGCHDTHGSDVSRLLTKPYPEPFYQPFEEAKYDLCFSCHDKQLVLTEKTANLTSFRNGDRNLHYLHVNKEKGRNCRSCHQTHASSNELHVSDTVPFGKWEMPIKFDKTDAGGSCSPGCHKPFAYDRNNPVDYQATPAASPAAVSATDR